MQEPTWWERAQTVMPGGVNSPVRSFKGVGGAPFFVDRGAGARLYSVEGTAYIDYVMSYGPLILGHAHPEVVAAAERAVKGGLSFGAPAPGEVTLAETIVRALPSMEMVRMVNSGTEATMSALRVARAATGRPRIIKFTGCYHGHHDSLLVRAGSGAATLGVPDSAGVPPELASLTITVPFNDLDAVRQAMARHRGEIAAVIVEPVAGNMGTVLPAPGFLEGLRQVTREHGALLVFDEVMTGFRVAWGGAQVRYGIEPDLTCLAKVIGAGMPVGAYGGRRDLMSLVAPLGPVYQAGTLSGNPVAMAAGQAQLAVIDRPGFYADLERRTEELARGLEAACRGAGQTASVVNVGAMLTLFFSDHAPVNFAEAEQTDRTRYQQFFHGMLNAGVFWPPSPFETLFPSAAHDDEVLETTLRAATAVLRTL